MSRCLMRGTTFVSPIGKDGQPRDRSERPQWLRPSAARAFHQHWSGMIAARLADRNLAVDRIVVANGLPLWGGAQLAVDNSCRMPAAAMSCATPSWKPGPTASWC